ncbi:hypothetical protein ACVBEH_06770 [Roseateles sp. GG27B]
MNVQFVQTSNSNCNSANSPSDKPIGRAVALSESVGQFKPFAAVFDGEALLLCRDSGVSCALRRYLQHNCRPGIIPL